MKQAAAAVLFLSFFCRPAEADILRLRTGEEKRGRVLAEDERRILLDSESDDSVVEVPRADISIWDREDPGLGSAGSYLGTYSSVPRKIRPPRPETGSGSGESQVIQKKPSERPPEDPKTDASSSFDAAQKLIEELITKHPEIESGLKELMDKTAKDSAELDKLVSAAKQS